MPQENQVQTEIPTDSTADGTPQESVSTDVSPAPASETSPTTPDASLELRSRVTGEDDYQKDLEAALAKAAEEKPSEAGEKPAEEEAPATPEAKEPKPEDGSEEEKPEEEKLEQEPAAKKEFRPRLSVLDERAQEAIKLARDLADKGTKISLAEAEQRIAAKYGDAKAPEQQQAPAEKTIEELRAEYDAKIADADKRAEELDVKGALVAQREASAIDKKIAQLEYREHISNENRTRTAIDESTRRTQEVYPVYSDTTHPIHQEVNRIWEEMKASENPLIFDPNNTFKLYQMAANNLAIAPGAKPSAAPSATPAKSSPPVTPKPQVIQQSAARRPNNAGPLASAEARTTQPGPDPIADLLGKDIRTQHEYEDLMRELSTRKRA